MESRYAGMDAVSKRISGIYKGRLVKLRTHKHGANSYRGQGATSIMNELPKTVDIRRTRHIDGHSNDGDRFQDGRRGFGGGDIAKANIQTSGGYLSLEVFGQTISRSYVEQLYGSSKAFQPLDSRRGNFLPISDLRKEHIQDFFDKWDTGGGRGSGESGDDWHFESAPRRKLDISVTYIGDHLISCPFVYRPDVIEGIDVRGKHRKCAWIRFNKRS